MNNRNSNKIKRILSVLFCLCLLVIPAEQASAGWEQVSEILSRIKAPQFPNRDFDINDYGAVADNQKDCTDVFDSRLSRTSSRGWSCLSSVGNVYDRADPFEKCIFDNVVKSNILIGVKNLNLMNVEFNNKPAK